MDHSKVYILLHNDTTTTCILGVFAALIDANHQCLLEAEEAGVSAAIDPGVQNRHMSWENAEGVTCWVEDHEIRPRIV